MNVATMHGPMIAVGFVEPGGREHADHRGGTSCTPEVLRAMNVTIALVAVSLCSLRLLQLFHRLDAERRGGVVEAEHVRGDATSRSRRSPG